MWGGTPDGATSVAKRDRERCVKEGRRRANRTGDPPVGHCGKLHGMNDGLARVRSRWPLP